MPRCNKCRQFVSISSDLDPNSQIRVDAKLQKITGYISLMNSCDTCGNALQRHTFSLNESMREKVGDHICLSGDVWLARINRAERYHEERPPHKKVRITYYGVRGFIWVGCACSQLSFVLPFKYEVKASEMEKL